MAKTAIPIRKRFINLPPSQICVRTMRAQFQLFRRSAKERPNAERSLSFEECSLVMQAVQGCFSFLEGIDAQDSFN